ncbi:MAG TPA: T9SS C-terminal target domain-containing protein, partial [Bacteroidetes bacterium]|nr:T9SS C-terminal target domain-containing protein [Bacteroidota bacterium]
NPNTIIEFNVKTASEIQLKVFDITGKNISIPVNERKYPGSYEVNFDGSNYSSGIYFYSLYSDG